MQKTNLIPLPVGEKSSCVVGKKIPVIMKSLFYACLIGSASLTYASNSYAQTAKVSLHAQNQTVENVMKQIEENSNFTFFYNDRHVDLDRRVSISVNESNIYKVLDTVFSNSDISYKIVDDKIVLTKKEAGISSVAQDGQVIKGTVVDPSGTPVIGANVVVAGTTHGTVTDLDGNFSLEVEKGATLVVSYIGFNDYKVKVGGQKSLAITLKEDSQALDEVVVTAMGIERKSKSLTYATSQVSGQELTRAKDANMINALQGKTAGLSITPNSSGAGGSTKIVLRGNKSAFGSNEALIVIDGIPMNNTSSAQMGTVFKGRDGGDALSTLNPDDIASINVLKGASAAALYGSLAANGVVMITTKKGRDGAARVDFSSNITVETPLVYPDLQGRYGAAQSGEVLTDRSWGEKLYDNDDHALDRVKDFFRTGSTYINSVTVNGGTEKAQSFMSYANTTALGIVPTNNFYRHNMTARQTFKLFDDRLTLDASLSYVTQKGVNRFTGGIYHNPLPGTYTFPINADWDYYKNNYEVFDEDDNINTYNWYVSNDDFSVNPYWVLNRMRSVDRQNRFMASASAKFQITDWLSIQGRLSIDNMNTRFEQKIYATSPSVYGSPGGKLSDHRLDTKQFYGDIMLTANKTWNDTWELNATIGSSFKKNESDKLMIETDRLGLSCPNYFLPQAVSKANPIIGSKGPRKRLNSVFGTAQFGYKGMVYLDITGRNDWSSALAFTDNMSYFYPSFGLTGLLNEMIPMSKKINQLKVRGSYSIVGNDVPAYITHPMDGFGQNSYSPNTTKPFTEMKPEKMHSFEVGVDLAMFDNHFNFDFTYYKSNNKNQYFSIQAPVASGYGKYYVNAGNIQNQGFESSMSYRWDFAKDWSWKTDFNVSYNKNKISELPEQLKDGVNLGGGNNVYFRLVEGGSFGDIYAKCALRNEDGSFKLNKKGRVLISTDMKHVGNVNPDWQLGWGNTFTYKNFNLYFLIDGKIGGNVVSQTQSYLDAYGMSKASADARDNGGVDIGNGQKANAEDFYKSVAGTNGAKDLYVYSATNFRLRELSLGYTFYDILGASKNLNLSFIARNLFFIYKDSPNDPDMSMSKGNGMKGFDSFGLPATRSFGINAKITF